MCIVTVCARVVFVKLVSCYLPQSPCFANIVPHLEYPQVALCVCMWDSVLAVSDG